jgi:hypothetical protein
MTLPPPSAADEDAWVDTLAAVRDPAELVKAIEAAMAERRPRLAARLVALLDQAGADAGSLDCEEADESTPVSRARLAAGLTVVGPPTLPEPEPGWRELEEAFAELRRRRARRLRHRYRRFDHDGPRRPRR